MTTETNGAAEPEKGYSVFVSHASADREAAEAIVASLESKGLTCWIAPRDVRPGAEYAEEILRGITQSKCFILVLSEAANLSTHVRREVERAASKGKAIYPVRIEDVPPSPKLEFFVSMHHWIDAWEGAIDDHAGRIAMAIDSGEEWIGNRVVRRRRWLSGGTLTVVALIVVALATVFAGDIRRQMLDSAGRARADLEAANVPVNAAGLEQAMAAADAHLLNLFQAAEIGRPTVAQVLSRRHAAEGFFKGSKDNPEAIAWFKEVLAEGVDPNLTVPHDNYEKESLLRWALRAGNAEAAIALLEAGGSPYVYQNLWFTTGYLPMAVYPYSYIDEYPGFSEEERAAMARAFVATGAAIPVGDAAAGSDELGKARDRILNRYGVEVPGVTTICETGPTLICESAAARTGFDWCAFGAELPRALHSPTADYYEFTTVELLQLVNVVDDQAQVLVNLPDGWSPGLGLAEISKDMNTWYVYKYMQPAWGMGHCKPMEDGYVPDDCWRRVNFVQTEDEAVMQMEGYYDYEKLPCP